MNCNCTKIAYPWNEGLAERFYSKNSWHVLDVLIWDGNWKDFELNRSISEKKCYSFLFSIYHPAHPGQVPPSGPCDAVTESSSSALASRDSVLTLAVNWERAKKSSTAPGVPRRANTTLLHIIEPLREQQTESSDFMLFQFLKQILSHQKVITHHWIHWKSIHYLSYQIFKNILVIKDYGENNLRVSDLFSCKNAPCAAPPVTALTPAVAL